MLLLPPRPFEIAGFDAEIDALVFEVYRLNGLEIDLITAEAADPEAAT